MKKIYRFILLMLVFAGTCMMTGCSQAQKSVQEFGRTTLYFDTVISLKFYAEKDRGEELMNACMELCSSYEQIFSRTNEKSELYRVNHRTANRVEVSDELAELVAYGLDYYEKTEGKFDITVAPLSDLWDFKSEDAAVPEEALIREADQKVGADAVHVEGNELVFDNPDTMIDLGALVKGYAADHLKEYLVGQGVESGLIDLGGNILTIGRRPDGNAWKIGIQQPFAARSTTAAVLDIVDQTVVSSGIYERYFEQDETIYHHILDPDTGYPAENDIEGVSIICDSSLMGDALSTSCLLLGTRDGEALINQEPEVRAVFILRETGDPVYIGFENQR